MVGVREWDEGMGVMLATAGEGYPKRSPELASRLVVRALNECGHNQTSVDLLDLLAWVRAHRPDLWAEANK